MHVRRGDVGGDKVIAQRGRHLVTEHRSIAGGDPLERLSIDYEILDKEAGVGQPQRAGLVDRPRPLDGVGVGEPDERALVVGEVTEVPAEGTRQPRRRTDDRRALNIGADAGMTGRRDDRASPTRSTWTPPSVTRRVLAG